MSTLAELPITHSVLSLEMLQLAMNHLPQSIFWKDRDLVYLGCNQRFAQDALVATPADIVGKTDYAMPWKATAELYRADDRKVIDSGVAKLNFEEPQHRPDGSTLWLRTSKIPLLDSEGQIVGVLGMYEDITEYKRIESERIMLQEQVIHAQQAALAELSTPLIPITDDVVVMPLIGAMDTQRTQRILNTLLEGVANTHARVAILDITGVAVVDTQIASVLVRAAQAVNLLGTQVVLTGIRPEVAQTMVGLGVDLKSIVTRGTLQSGIAYAVGQLGQPGPNTRLI